MQNIWDPSELHLGNICNICVTDVPHVGYRGYIRTNLPTYVPAGVNVCYVGAIQYQFYTLLRLLFYVSCVAYNDTVTNFNSHLIWAQPVLEVACGILCKICVYSYIMNTD